MNIRVKFFGGAKTVTGSKYLLEIGDFLLLVDCGVFQGKRDIRSYNWNDLPIEASKIDAVILTHAHIDHSGYLPKLVKDGFEGKVYCTSATAALCEILLRDSAKILKEEATFIGKKLSSPQVSGPMPLYDIDDVEKVFEKWVCHDYNTLFNITDDISVNFHDAGHILGSAIVELTVKGDSQTKTIVFSGDLGRPYSPILHPPSVLNKADVLFVESTYGKREMPEDIWTELTKAVNEAFDKQGMLLIPSFAVGRTQQLIFMLKKLRDENKIPKVQIYIDSPMAINVTSLYDDFHRYHKLEKEGFKNVFNHPEIHYYQDKELSKSLNSIDEACIVISASGMCNGGRIMHHLYHRLRKKNDTLLFVGYQAEETKGRTIIEKNAEVDIFGEKVPILCNIKKINGLSAHADKSELIDWIKNFKDSPKWVFIIHGEEESSISLQHSIVNELGWKAVIPDYLESFELFRGI